MTFYVCDEGGEPVTELGERDMVVNQEAIIAFLESVRIFYEIEAAER